MIVLGGIILQTKIKNYIKIALLLLFIFALIYIGKALHDYSNMLEEQQKAEVISSRFIGDKLESMSELTTAKMTYNGIVEYTDGNIPFVNKKAFLMIYRAEVEAGLDLAQAKTEVTDKSVEITLPAITVQQIDIDNESIKFYDEKSSLFNWINKEDAIAAIEAAKSDVEEKGDMDGLIQRSQEQTEILLYGLFEGSIGERELIIKFKK